MRIVIVGAGVIGSNLAGELSRDHEVYLIEENPATAGKAGEKLDVKVIVGSGSDPSVLTQAPVHQADMVIAVTASDETNVVVCVLANIYGTKVKVARVRNASLARALKRNQGSGFMVDEIINPEDLAADAILKSIETPGAREVADFANGEILFRVFDIEKQSSLCGIPLGSLREKDFPWPFLIVAVMRNGEVLFPKGETSLQEGDRIYVLLPKASAGEFLTFVHPGVQRSRKVVVFGGTKIGEILATLLCKREKETVLIEADYSIAEGIADRQKDLRVIHGGATESDILREAGIEAADVFVAVSKDDQDNLVSAMLAKKLGAKTTIITTTAHDYASIVDAMDIDAVFNARFLAVDQILKIVRGKRVHAVTTFSECDAEALELIPEEGSPVSKAPLKKIAFPKDSIVGAVFRNNEVVLASGDLQIQPGEKVIVFCREHALKKLERLFTKKEIFK